MKKLLIVLVALIAVQSAYAGICSPTAWHTTPYTDGETRNVTEGDSAVIRGTCTYNTGGACDTIYLGQEFQEDGSSTWKSASIGENISLLIPIYTPYVARCFFGSCSIRHTVKYSGVGEDYEIRFSCKSGSETRYSQSVHINVSPETTPPVIYDHYPYTGFQDSDGDVRLMGKCYDSINDVVSAEFWSNHTGGYHMVYQNTSYTDFQWFIFNLSGIDDGESIVWGINCTDTRGNFVNQNYTLTSVYNSSPLIARQVTPANNTNYSWGEDVIAYCEALNILNVTNISIVTNISGSWEITDTRSQGDGWYYYDEEFDDIQYGHIRATDGTHYVDEVRFDASWIPTTTGMTGAQVCIRQASGSADLDDDDITTCFVDNADGWTPFMSAGDFNDEIVQNCTNTVMPNYPDAPDSWYCVDILNAVLQSQSQGDEYMIIRLIDPDNNVTTATALNFFTTYIELGNTSFDSQFYYEQAVHGVDNIPYFKVQYYKPLQTLAMFNLSTMPDNTSYGWKCEAYDYDSPSNYDISNMYVFNYGLSGGGDPCLCSVINSSGVIDLSENCVLNTDCNISNAITFTNSGSVTFNATIRISTLGLFPSPSDRGFLGSEARVLQVV